MYPEILSYLCCPEHPGASLLLEAGAQVQHAPGQTTDGAILNGWLHCSAGPERYRIRHGIVDLLGPHAAPDSLAQLANYLPPTAWAYERTWRPRALTIMTGEPFGYRRELPLITGLIEPERGGLYVDVACSNGLYARAIERKLAGQPGHVVGIDHSLPMLRQARSFAQRSGQRISFVRARAQTLPFAPAAVAGVAMGGSLNEIGDADGCLREVRRVLAPTGRFVMMNLVAAEHLTGRLLQGAFKPGGIDFWPLSRLNRHLATCGFDLMAQWRYRVVVFSLLLPRLTSAAGE